jgi:hypothetical protein
LEDLYERGFESGDLETVPDTPNESDRVNVSPDILEKAADERW